MQTLGRIAIVGGLIAVAMLNIAMFSGVEAMTAAETASIYAEIYLLALIIPAISVGGVVLGTVSLRSRARGLRRQGLDHDQIERMLFAPAEETKPNWWIFGGSIVFVAFIMGESTARTGSYLPWIHGDRFVPDVPANHRTQT
jgi:hypothetical protein